MIVAKQGGDFASVKAAVDATWTLASAAQPYLVKVMPGVFDETGLIQVPAYVDVEGSGVSVTTVRSHTSGLLLRGSGIEIRHLTVEVQGNETTGACPRSSASGISLMDGQTARLTNMAVRAVDSNYSVAVDQQNSYLQLRNVDVYASAITVPGCTSYAKAVHVIGGEVDVQGGSVEAYGGTGSGSIAPNGAVWLAGGGRATLVGTNVFGEHAALELGPYNTPPTDVNVVTLFAARVQGGVYALDTSWTASIAKASGTQFTGPIHFGGTLKLRNCMDANFDPL